VLDRVRECGQRVDDEAAPVAARTSPHPCVTGGNSRESERPPLAVRSIGRETCRRATNQGGMLLLDTSNMSNQPEKDDRRRTHPG